jgi:hypothetical protein
MKIGLIKKSRKSFLALAAFAAACVFFGVAAFGGTISDWPLQDAGLFSAAIGFTIDHWTA